MKTIDTTQLAALSAKARASLRGRANQNFHPELADPVQRFLNAIEPDSYVRAHRHSTPHEKWELFVILSGAARVLILDETSKVLECLDLDASGPNLAVEIPAGAWHTLAATQTGTVLFEFKQGPYCPLDDKDFAHWAPTEDTPESSSMIRRYLEASIGDRLA